jgi:hypothetical protein
MQPRAYIYILASRPNGTLSVGSTTDLLKPIRDMNPDWRDLWRTQQLSRFAGRKAGSRIAFRFASGVRERCL